MKGENMGAEGEDEMDGMDAWSTYYHTTRRGEARLGSQIG